LTVLLRFLCFKNRDLFQSLAINIKIVASYLTKFSPYLLQKL